jgi:uncharacterized protein YyaL (SSP411 family)
MPNHLANETSPYLLQHVDNPVDWYPWGEEALLLAKEQDKPLLLSIGYAACHWCHVMAHESFEDEETAALMNQYFVNIKVDREERPDLDSIYMDAVVSLTGHGGWPMTVALTPDGEPFYGGTYFPREPRHGLPGFKQVLLALADAWQNRRAEVEKGALQITEHISRKYQLDGDGRTLGADLLEGAVRTISKRFDPGEGGFGSAPKFPQPMTIEFLLQEDLRKGDKFALHMAEHTLRKMAYGGMYDQLGGGFARYATDERWLVPHFEKMLYDNAQLARVYLHAWQVTGERLYKRIVEETLDYVLLEMQHQDGGFYSSQDADSEGVEGKFYVWTPGEIRDALGDDAELFMRYYDVSEGGNWEGVNILNMKHEPIQVAESFQMDEDELSQRIAAARKTLYAVRARRVWPGLDDKVLTSWNGLMLAAFAEAGRALGRADYTAAATRNAEFLYRTMRTGDGRLLRTWKAGAARWRAGEAKYNAFLEDHANLAEGLLALYQNTFDLRWFRWAVEVAEIILAHFYDEADGGFFDTSDDHEQLIHRPKDVQDNALPSGNAMAATILLKLSLYTGNQRYWNVAETAVASMGNAIAQAPTGFGQWLIAASFILSEPQELAIVGEPEGAGTAAMLDALRGAYRPNLVVAAGREPDGETIALLAQRPMIEEKATAYLCRRFMCKAPVTAPEQLLAQLG